MSGTQSANDQEVNLKRKLASLTVMAAITLVVAVCYAGQKAAPWKATESAAEVKNPIRASAEGIERGQKIFTQQCVPCHGERGKGDGPAGKYLGTTLPDFTSAEMNKQTDGELFWKISTGKAPMPTFEQILSDEQRWLVVHYLRTFCADEHSSNK